MASLAVSSKILLSLVNCIIDLNNKMMDQPTEYSKKPIQALCWSLFQMLDMECVPALIVVASDAAHRCNVVVFRPMYFTILFDVPLILPCVLTCLFFSLLIQLEGV